MYTTHARVRMQQRGIPPLIVEWLIEYGATAFDHAGGRIRFFDKESRTQLRRAKGEIALRRFHELLDCYAVVAEDDTVITVGHKYRRLRTP